MMLLHQDSTWGQVHLSAHLQRPGSAGPAPVPLCLQQSSYTERIETDNQLMELRAASWLSGLMCPLWGRRGTASEESMMGLRRLQPHQLLPMRPISVSDLHPAALPGCLATFVKTACLYLCVSYFLV